MSDDTAGRRSPDDLPTREPASMMRPPTPDVEQLGPMRGEPAAPTGPQVPPDRLLTLETLVPKLKGLSDEPRPFAVLLGAGASMSAGIPGARAIAELIQEKCPDEVKDCQKRDYATLVASLLPARRYELLKDYVDKAKLNAAHLYLAALVKAGWVDMILTTNFDPLMLRALAQRAFVRPNVYDVPNTKDFASLSLIPPALVYLHGQFSSFITVHTVEEDAAVRKDVLHALTEATRGRALVVVGYSGESDPLFTQGLCRPSQFPHGLFWVHHSEGNPRAHVVTELLAKPTKYAFCIRGEPADRFFPRLATALDVQSTHIAFRPFSFLKEALDDLAPVQVEQGQTDFAADVRRQVDTAIGCFEQGRPCDRVNEEVAKSRREDAIRRATRAWLEGRYDELGSIEYDARKIQSVEALVVIAKALLDRARRLHGDDAIKVYDEVVERFGKATETALLEQVARALFNKGVTLGQLGRHDDAIKAYDEVVERFGKATETALLEQVARALVNKGFALGRLGRSEDEIKVYDEVVERFGKATETALLVQVARALFNKGVTLGRLGRSEDEIKVYDEVVERFGKATETALLERVAMALECKACALALTGKTDRAFEALEQALARGFSVEEVEADPDLKSLRDDARWTPLLDKFRRPPPKS